MLEESPHMPRTLIRYLADDMPAWGVQFGAAIAPLNVGALSTGRVLTEH